MGFNTTLIAALLLFLLCTCTRGAPMRRPPPPTDNTDGESKEEDKGTLQTKAESTKTSAREATQAATIMKSYLVSEYLNANEPSPMPPCFIEERDPGELTGHHNPAVDYQEKLQEDYESLEWYDNYWDYLEQKNSTNSSLGYQTRFTEVRTRHNRLLGNMTTLFEAANITMPECTVEWDETKEDTGAEKGEKSSVFPEHCYNTSYEQQARIYQRYLSLTSQYIIIDIDGVIQQKATT